MTVFGTVGRLAVLAGEAGQVRGGLVEFAAWPRVGDEVRTGKLSSWWKASSGGVLGGELASEILSNSIYVDGLAGPGFEKNPGISRVFGGWGLVAGSVSSLPLLLGSCCVWHLAVILGRAARRAGSG